MAQLLTLSAIYYSYIVIYLLWSNFISHICERATLPSEFLHFYGHNILIKIVILRQNTNSFDNRVRGYHLLNSHYVLGISYSVLRITVLFALEPFLRKRGVCSRRCAFLMFTVMGSRAGICTILTLAFAFGHFPTILPSWIN